MNKIVAHPANTLHILSSELETALTSVQDIPVNGGPVLSLTGNARDFPCLKIRKSCLPPVLFAIEEGKGIDVKIRQRVKRMP